MATRDYMPFGDCKVQAPGAAFTLSGVTRRAAIWAAMIGYTERQNRAGQTYNAQTSRGAHLVGVYDITTGANIGRYVYDYVMGGSSLTSGQAHLDVLLSATPNRDVPDLCQMDGTVYIADGGLYGTAPGKEQDLTAAFQDDGGVFTDYTTAMASVATDDVNLLPAVPVVNDAFYFGRLAAFPRWLIVRVSTAGAGTWTLTWEYYSTAAGGSWAALTGVSDGTTGFTTAGRKRVTFTAPTNAATTTVNGVLAYYIRARVSAFTSITTQPKAAYGFAMEGTTAFSGKCAVIGEDPAVVVPAVRTWGVDSLEDDQSPLLITASTLVGTDKYSSLTFDVRDHGNNAEIDQVRVYANVASSAAVSVIVWMGVAFYDSVRDREGKIVTIFQSNLLGKVALSQRIRIGTYALNSVGNTITDTTVADLAYQLVLGATVVFAPTDTGAGPTTADAGQTAKAGMFTTCAVLNRQVWVGGSPARDTTTSTHRLGFRNYIAVSAIGKGHQFPVAQGFHLEPSDGDGVVALRPLDGKMVVLKSTHVYMLDSAPTIGQVPRVIARYDGVGCLALRSAIVVGNYLYFLSAQGLMRLHGNGTLEPLPLSTPVRDVLLPALRDNPQAMHMAACGYDPVRDLLLLSAPALQQQVTGGANAGNTSGGAPSHNDGILACHLRTQQWALWTGPPYLACFATGIYHNTTAALGPMLFAGGYNGRPYRLSQQTQDGLSVGAGSYTTSGTVTASGATSLTDTGATFPATASGNRHFLHAYVEMTSGTSEGQIREVSASTATVLTLGNAWTTNPAVGDTYRLFVITGHVDTGDLRLGVPHLTKSLFSVKLQLAEALVSPNAIDVAVDPTGSAETGTGFTYAAGTLGTGVDPVPLLVPLRRGYVSRLRIAFRQHGVERFRIVSAVLGWMLSGVKAKAKV